MEVLLKVLIFLATSSRVSAEFSCGKTMYTSGLIVRGDEVTRGEWPFIAALFKADGKGFFCAGTLITSQHVVSAAHCVQPKYESATLKASDAVVYLGKYNIHATFERGSVPYYIKKIIVHPDWETQTEDYDADISILLLESSVQYSNFIMPACWPFQVTTFNQAIIIGWGRSEQHTVENNLKKLVVQPVPNDVCFINQPEFAKISSLRTFCAGSPNAGPCNGDSGGGLFTKYNGLWYLRGVISSSFLINGECDVSKFALYTNVAMYSDWVKRIVKETEGKQQEYHTKLPPQPNPPASRSGFGLPCKYVEMEFEPKRILKGAESVKSRYSCKVDALNVSDPHVRITRATGNHRDGQSNANVEEVYVEKKVAVFLPNGLGQVFPNLDLFYIAECGLRSVSRFNFESMKRLSTLSISGNEIRELPVDVFTDLESLEWLDLGENRLTSLPENLLANLPELQEIYAYRNKLEYLSGNMFKNNLKLERIEFDQNRLKSISSLDLFRFKNLRVVCMRYNVCVSKRFPDDIDLRGINEAIRINCSHHSSI